MTLPESPPGAELRVTEVTYAFWAASSSGPRLRHMRAVFVPLIQRAIVDLSGAYRPFARSVDEKVRLQSVRDLAFTP